MVCQCICQICICGKHTCPVHGKSNLSVGKGDISQTTEYSNRYRAHEVCVVKSCKPEECIAESGDFCAQTTTKTDYRPHECAKRDLIKYDDTLKPKGRIDTNTLYSKEFPAKEICRVNSCKPNYDWCQPEAFCADSTMRSDYKGWSQKPRNNCKPVRMSLWVFTLKLPK